MTDEIPEFVFATIEEKASWRSLPMTAAFSAYLDWQFNRIADAALAAVRLDRVTEAKILLGHLDALQGLRAAINGAPPSDERADAEAAFIDPAALWRK